MAVLYSLYYAFKRDDGLWFHGMTFVALYMSVLVFQTYWGILTMRDTRWGTRSSTVIHAQIDQDRVTALPSQGEGLGVVGRRRGSRHRPLLKVRARRSKKAVTA